MKNLKNLNLKNLMKETKKYMKELIKKYDVDDDIEKSEEEAEKDFNEHGINIDGLNKDGLNINGLDEDGLHKNGYNINGIDKNGLDKNGLNIYGTEGSRIKYPREKLDSKVGDNNILYDQYEFDKKRFNKNSYDVYEFDKKGFNKDGLNKFGFDEKGFNKDGVNKYGYKKSSGRGLNISSLPILLSKIYTNNSSKELINEIKN